jgi:hypothetical protein
VTVFHPFSVSLCSECCCRKRLNLGGVPGEPSIVRESLVAADDLPKYPIQSVL